jgi:thiol-disulfide isomerase/thioredoxin
MKSYVFRWTPVVWLVVILLGCGQSERPSDKEEGPVMFRKNIVGIRLAAPRTDKEAAYLGVPSDGSEFELTEIKSRVLLVQLFDMYCTNCQREAPEVNRLYEQVQVSDLKDRVRFVGIGKGNTETEVDIFRDRYKVPFPLFADLEKVNTRRLGVERTPNFIIVNLKDRKVAHQQWRISSAEELLEKLREAAK